MINTSSYWIIKDIRFWILFFFVIRLYGITNPPLEVSHNWRQTTVTMVARNFLETDNSIFFPRIDIAGEKTGITGMEFPLLNYLVYLVSEVFGYQHWYGRLINLILSSFGLWFFYRLIRRYFREEVSFYSTLILAVSIWFQFSRKIMPDTFAMSFIIAGMYYGSLFLEEAKGRLLHLVLSWVFIVAGVLSKLPSAYLLVVFVLLFSDRKIPLPAKTVYALAMAIAFIPVVTWYYYWVPHLVDTYGFWHFFMGKQIRDGVQEIFNNLTQTFSRFYDTALKFSGFAIFCWGLIQVVVNREKRLYTLFIITLLAFTVIVLKAGFTFPHHSYYIVPFVPVMALVAGYGLASIRNARIALLLMIVVGVEGIANQQDDFRIRKQDRYIADLEQEMDKFSHRDDLIVINSGDYPTPMYFAHRKGWVSSNQKIAEPRYIHELTEKGLQYIVILKTGFGTEIHLADYPVVFENDNLRVYAAKK